MSLDNLSGRSYGPIDFDVTRAGVARFVEATGDDPGRWTDRAPPSLAAAALFAVVPSFLEDPDVAPTARTAVHAEQSFTWHRALRVGQTLAVSGTVEEIRSRARLNVVTFEVTAGDEEPWLSSTSTFVLSDAAAGSADEEPEPPDADRGPCDPVAALPLASVGDAVAPVRRSASRADLVRYAAATGDWNPIHWDHDAARNAGMAGVIVHGLLMAAWLAQVAARYGADPAPLRSMRVRFRAPLRPAVEALVTGEVVSAHPGGAEIALELRAGDARLVTAAVGVTR